MTDVTGHLNDNPPDIDFFDESEPVEVSQNTLERLSELALEYRALELEIQADTVALEEKKSKFDKLKGRTIPGIMQELQLTAFKMADGASIETKKDVRASILVENRSAAWLFLEKNKMDGIIKTEVVAPFAKGKLAEASKAVEALKGLGVDASIDRSVHPATLKAFVKERMDVEGAADPKDETVVRLPRDIFNVYEFTEAKIKLPRVKKTK